MYFLYTLKCVNLLLNSLKDCKVFKNSKNIIDNEIIANVEIKEIEEIKDIVCDDSFILVFSNENLIQNYYNFISFLSDFYYKYLNKEDNLFLSYLKDFFDLSDFYNAKDFLMNLPLLTYHNLYNLVHILQNLYDTKSRDLLKKVVNIGDKYDIYEFANILEKYGYKKVGLISQYFEYNIRGNIIDVFPYLSEYPVRIEFDEDFIESIRYFDKDEFLSIKKINSFILLAKNQKNFLDNFSLFNYFSKRLIFITDLSEELFKNRLYFILKNEYNLELGFIKDFLNNVRIFYIDKLLNEGFSNLPDLSLKQSILIDYIYKKFKGYRGILFSKTLQDFIKIDSNFDKLSVNIEVIENDKIIGGFIDNNKKLIIITEADINGLNNNLIKKDLKRDFIIDIDRFQEGDLVVVDNLGIGIYLGIKNIEIKPGYHKDMALVLFKNNKKVYLNIENVYIHRYIASKEITNKIKEKILSKPSLSDWNKKIRELYVQTKDLADTILRINSNRLNAKSVSFLKTDLEELISKDFIYKETPDQLKAINEVLKDLESTVPANRLIIGDTGYGKTEVLLRAIARVVSNKYKVLFIVPSTVLAYQHYTNLYNRLNKYLPDSIRLYCSIEKNSNKNLKDFIENDNVLLLVSTNLDLDKLRDISNKIGLVIIDEEHLLGVLFKEKVKEIFMNSHMLMVSATPIPRTLFLSLNSLIDTTIISTPPVNYKKPFVFLFYFNDRKNAYDILLALIYKHLFRGSNSPYQQIYYVNNNIDELYLIYKYLLENFDKNNIKIRMNILHSKLSRNLIEKIFIDFINKKYDIILSTTLMQSGLDNPNVNVMIIDNSHLLGLSQIYQLRGRVSRQGTQGYCYILFPQDLVNTKTFERISFFEKEDLSNYDVVLKDLELRGPGTLLSKKQSGFIDKIGVIQYLRLLSSYINKNNQENSNFPEIITDLPMFLDESPYKNILYRKLILANTLEQFHEIKNQIIDIYGKKLSKNTQNLLFAIYNRIKYKGKAKKIFIKINQNNNDDYELHFE